MHPLPVDPILLSGPSITHREIECAADAAAVGWNMKAAGYIYAFQKRLAHYTGQKYAFATCNGAAAMHLALMALRVGPGDEVLVPEIADISVAFSVLHTGARPVFCDVDHHSLCLAPESVAANITPRTRGMLPVHLYGHPCNMAPLMDLAAQHKLFILENATQGLGSLYRGHPAGSLGHFSTFSFSGMDAVVAGEGGMLLSSSRDMFSQAVKLGSLGRSADNPFIHDAIGYEYTISNIQAALGSAQMERIEELLAKKRQIFDWYKERLHDVPGIRLNAETPDCRNSFLMSTLVCDDTSMLRHDFLQRLLASNVICRPVFYPLSSMPMFTRADNPVAYSTGVRAIVLPSGHNRTEEEVEYIASVIKQLLKNKSIPAARVQPTGWLKYKADVLARIALAKSEGLSIPFSHDAEEYSLRVLTAEDAVKPEIVTLLTQWQQENIHAFLSHVPVTEADMHERMCHYPDRARDFILFFIVRGQELLGHMGLDNFSFQKNDCVAEALIMRPDAPRGLAAAASEALYAWAKSELGITRVYNHVVGSNTKVRLLASAQGFREVNKTPLYKKAAPGGAIFRPMYVLGHDRPEEYFVFSAKDL